jgi:hypothetical protein
MRLAFSQLLFFHVNIGMRRCLSLCLYEIRLQREYARKGYRITCPKLTILEVSFISSVGQLRLLLQRVLGLVYAVRC